MPEPCEKNYAVSGAEESVLLEDCIRKLSEGDIDSVGPIYDATKNSVYAYSLSLLKNSAEAEDVMHDCYIRICSSARSYQPKGKPMAWILTIARNLCLSRLREMKRQTLLDEEDWHRLLKTDEIETNLHVAEMMRVLSDSERQIVLLHTVSGFKHRETAALMGLPLATVLTKYSRAMKKLRKLFPEGGAI